MSSNLTYIPHYINKFTYRVVDYTKQEKSLLSNNIEREREREKKTETLDETLDRSIDVERER